MANGRGVRPENSTGCKNEEKKNESAKMQKVLADFCSINPHKDILYSGSVVKTKI